MCRYKSQRSNKNLEQPEANGRFIIPKFNKLENCPSKFKQNDEFAENGCSTDIKSKRFKRHVDYKQLNNVQQIKKLKILKSNESSSRPQSSNNGIRIQRGKIKPRPSSNYNCKNQQIDVQPNNIFFGMYKQTSNEQIRPVPRGNEEAKVQTELKSEPLCFNKITHDVPEPADYDCSNPGINIFKGGQYGGIFSNVSTLGLAKPNVSVVHHHEEVRAAQAFRSVPAEQHRRPVRDKGEREAAKRQK